MRRLELRTRQKSNVISPLKRRLGPKAAPIQNRNMLYLFLVAIRDFIGVFTRVLRKDLPLIHFGSKWLFLPLVCLADSFLLSAFGTGTIFR